MQPKTFRISQFDWIPKERVLFAIKEDLFNDGDIYKIIYDKITIVGRCWVVTFSDVGMKYKNIPGDEVWFEPLDRYKDIWGIDIKDILVKVKFLII